MIWREAVEKTAFPRQNYGATMPEAAKAIFKLTGRDYVDDVTGLSFKALNFEKAIDFVMKKSKAIALLGRDLSSIQKRLSSRCPTASFSIKANLSA